MRWSEFRIITSVCIVLNSYYILLSVYWWKLLWHLICDFSVLLPFWVNDECQLVYSRISIDTGTVVILLLLYHKNILIKHLYSFYNYICIYQTLKFQLFWNHCMLILITETIHTFPGFPFILIEILISENKHLKHTMKMGAAIT